MKTSRDNFCLSSAGLAEGTNPNTIQLAALSHFVIGGRAFRKAITDNIALVANANGPAFSAIGNNQVGCLFIMINSAGTVTAIQSASKTSSAGAGYVPGAFEWPADFDGFACIGAIRVTCGAAATFTPGATDLSAAGVTGQYHDVALDYGKPITY